MNTGQESVFIEMLEHHIMAPKLKHNNNCGALGVRRLTNLIAIQEPTIINYNYMYRKSLCIRRTPILGAKINKNIFFFFFFFFFFVPV